MPVDKQIRVIQVLNDTSCLAHFFWLKKVPELNEPTKVESWEELVCIQDYDTKAMLDNRLFDCDQTFEVVGTYMYRTLTGSNKILLLKPLKDK